MFARLFFEFNCRLIDGVTDPKLIELNWEMAKSGFDEQKLQGQLKMNRDLSHRWTERERVAVENKDRSSAQKARMQEKYYERKVSELENKLTRMQGTLKARQEKVRVIEQRGHEERVRKLTRENKLNDEVVRLQNLIKRWRERAQVARHQGSSALAQKAIDQCAVYQRQLDKLPAQK